MQFLIDICSSIVDMHVDCTSEVTQNMLCGGVVLRFYRNIVLGKMHDGQYNIRVSVHHEIKEFTYKFLIFGLNVFDVWMNIGWATKGEVWVHGQGHRITVSHAVFLQEVGDVVLLVHPQLMCLVISNKLHTEVLSNCSKVGDPKSLRYLCLCMVHKTAVV